MDQNDRESLPLAENLRPHHVGDPLLLAEVGHPDDCLILHHAVVLTLLVVVVIHHLEEGLHLLEEVVLRPLLQGGGHLLLGGPHLEGFVAVLFVDALPFLQGGVPLQDGPVVLLGGLHSVDVAALQFVGLLGLVRDQFHQEEAEDQLEGVGGRHLLNHLVCERLPGEYPVVQEGL